MTIFKRKSSIYQKNRVLLHLGISVVLYGIILSNGLSIKAQEMEINYHGFKVDFSQIKNSSETDRIIKAVKRQIEIVEEVKPSKEDLNFFKSIPIVMIPETSGQPGIYNANKNTVFLKARDLAPNRPILLHELLHAYHNLKIKDGFQNAQIRMFYEQARNNYPNFQNEYFLSNAKEFFAVTASIYLFGDIPRPPFNKSAIKKSLPEYYKFLETLLERHSK